MKLRSLNFSVNRFFMKLFKTSDMQIVTEIHLAFGFRPPSAIVTDRGKTFAYNISYVTTNYISFLSCLDSVGFLYVSYCSISTALYWYMYATHDLLS